MCLKVADDADDLLPFTYHHISSENDSICLQQEGISQLFKNLIYQPQ